MQLRARTTFMSRGRLVHRGDAIEADDNYGRDLMRARLADAVPAAEAPPENAAHASAPEFAGKARNDGAGPPSSALQAAPPSPARTLTGSAIGEPPKRRRRPSAPPDLLDEPGE